LKASLPYGHPLRPKDKNAKLLTRKQKKEEKEHTAAAPSVSGGGEENTCQWPQIHHYPRILAEKVTPINAGLISISSDLNAGLISISSDLNPQHSPDFDGR